MLKSKISHLSVIGRASQIDCRWFNQRAVIRGLTERVFPDRASMAKVEGLAFDGYLDGSALFRGQIQGSPCAVAWTRRGLSDLEWLSPSTVRSDNETTRLIICQGTSRTTRTGRECRSWTRRGLSDREWFSPGTDRSDNETRRLIIWQGFSRGLSSDLELSRWSRI